MVSFTTSFPSPAKFLLNFLWYQFENPLPKFHIFWKFCYGLKFFGTKFRIYWFPSPTRFLHQEFSFLAFSTHPPSPARFFLCYLSTISFYHLFLPYFSFFLRDSLNPKFPSTFASPFYHLWISLPSLLLPSTSFGSPYPTSSTLVQIPSSNPQLNKL